MVTFLVYNFVSGHLGVLKDVLCFTKDHHVQKALKQACCTSNTLVKSRSIFDQADVRHGFA